jgi:hypothetical protein
MYFYQAQKTTQPNIRTFQEHMLELELKKSWSNDITTQKLKK